MTSGITRLRRFPLAWVVVIAAVPAAHDWCVPLAAQDSSDAEKKGDETRQRISPLPGRMTEYLLKLDRNKNGLLDPDEVPSQMSATIERYAEQLKLDASKPIRLDQLTTGVQQILEQKYGQGSLTPRQVATNRTRRIAQRVFSKYDTNDDGRLSRAEFRKAPELLRRADRDQDGVLTNDEFMGRVAPIRVAPTEKKSDADTSGKAARTRNKPPTGRTTKGDGDLPDWFRERDLDRDGQVEMREFTREWTSEKLAEFQRYDLSKDGTITPDECRAVIKNQPAAKSKD